MVMGTRVNLGSGNEPLAGWINIDLRNVPGVQLIANAMALPIGDGTVKEVNASSLVEHFENPYAVLDEVWRVLEPTGRFTMRVPTPWSQSGLLDPTHVFLADSKLWREILHGYFTHVSAYGEGVRYRDSKLLALICHIAVRCLRMRELAQTWRFECTGKRSTTSRAYVPWWLEEYGR
jgi:ubiquinone/menaquinone biosynthesis C-methylase UbiE